MPVVKEQKTAGSIGWYEVSICNIVPKDRMRLRKLTAGWEHRRYPDVLSFSRRMGEFWSWRKFVDCRKTKPDSADSISISVELALGSIFPEPEAITTPLISPIRNMREIYPHCFSAEATRIYPSAQIDSA